MHERAQLLALAERAEKAEGACRELDSDIGVAVGLPLKDLTGKPGWHGLYFVGRLPDYTSSLDAALTLYDEVPALIHSKPRWVVRDALRALAAQHPEEGSSDA